MDNVRAEKYARSGHGVSGDSPIHQPNRVREDAKPDGVRDIPTLIHTIFPPLLEVPSAPFRQLESFAKLVAGFFRPVSQLGSDIREQCPKTG